MKKIVFSILIMPFLLFLSGVRSFAQEAPRAYIIDDPGVLSREEYEYCLDYAERTAAGTGLNIMAVIADDIGYPKTDDHVIEYADDIYEQYCGINTDGILLLINNDTKYDWISTSGSGINYFSDYRIDKIFDDIYEHLTYGDHYRAINAFIEDIEIYVGLGKDNHQTEILGAEVDTESFAVNFFAMFFILLPVAVIASVIIYISYTRKYKLEKPSARIYALKNSTRFTVRTDIVTGVETHTVYSPRSTSSHSHSSSGRSHRSSTHHSSSGGRHGGGGRHR